MKRIIVICFLLALSLSASSQTGTIRGFLYDKTTGEVIPYGSVLLNETKASLSTDENGFFTFAQIKPGTYHVTATSSGFEKLEKEVIVTADNITNVRIFVEPASTINDKDSSKTLKEFEVTAEGHEKKRRCVCRL